MKGWYIFMVLWGSFVYSQISSDRNLLLEKATRLIADQPKESEKTALYILENFHDRPTRERAEAILVTALFNKNDITSALKEIHRYADSQNSVLQYTSAGILYNCGIEPDTEHLPTTEATPYLKKFAKIFKLLQKNNYTSAASLSGEILSQIEKKDIPHTKKLWLALLKQIPEKQRIYFVQTAHLLNKYFPGDEEIRTRTFLFLLSEGRDKIDKNDLSKENSILLSDDNTNMQLLASYYQLKYEIGFLKKNDKEYIEYRQKSEQTERMIHEELLNARSYWFTLEEDKAEKLVESSRSKARYLLIFFAVAGIVGIILMMIRYRSVKRQLQQFSMLSKKIAEYTQKKNSSAPISEKTENELLKRLDDFERSSLFLSPDISLQLLAKKLDTNTRYLSEVINSHKQKNFNTYINELRIQYILHQINSNAVYRNYKIKYLAEECGFSSHSQFASVFKSVTGMPPATYIKLISEQS